MNLRELLATIGEASMKAIERVHALDFVLGLKTHAGFLGTIAVFFDTRPYVALALVVAAYCLFALVRWPVAPPPPVPPPPPPAPRASTQTPDNQPTIVINIYDPKPPKTRKPRAEKKGSKKTSSKKKESQTHKEATPQQ